jgi:Predicted aminopeptidases
MAVVFLIVLTSSLFVDNEDEKIPVVKGLDAITIQKTREHVEFLSDDKLSGRRVGSAGALKAADYIVSCLKEIGVAPYEESYFQDIGIDEIIEITKTGGLFPVNRILKEASFIRNVLGKIEGKNKDEYIIVGAHYDHIGLSSDTTLNDRIFNGADDNASGVSAILQIAKAFVAADELPQKTIIFAFWDAEEIGLIGSKCFVALHEDISKVKSYLNLDMIGRNNNDTCLQVAFLYSDTTINYGQQIKESIEEYGLNIESVTDDETINRNFSQGSKMNFENFKLSSLFRLSSDNASFEMKGVPIFLFTTGLHYDYHKTSDHAEKISWAKLNDICKISFITAYKLANEETYSEKY